MRKLLTVFFMSILLFMITACGSDSTSNSSSDTATKENETGGNYPEKQIKLVIPYSPGGGTDVIFRLIAEEAEKHLGQPIVPVNMDGASATTGSKYVKDAEPDGYTILGHHDAIATAQLAGVVDYSFEAFEPVVSLTQTPMISTVRTDLGISNIEDLVKYAKENPGKVKWGMTPGDLDHLFMADFIKRHELTPEEFALINYQGTSAAVKALYANEITGGTFDIPSAKGYYEDGSFQGVGVAYSERLSQLPDVPTYKEQGVEMSFEITRGIFAPKGTPEDVIIKIEEAFKKALENPEIQKKINDDAGSVAKYIPHGEYKTFLEELQAKLNEQAELIK